MEMLISAIKFASEKHKEQVDKSNKPYIFHPLSVMLDERLPSEDYWCTAVLHDVIEDTDATADDLYHIGMTKEIVDAVVLLTKTKEIKYEDYLKKVKDNKIALAVKLADIANNTKESRLKELPKSLQEYLRAKYSNALKILAD